MNTEARSDVTVTHISVPFADVFVVTLKVVASLGIIAAALSLVTLVVGGLLGGVFGF